MIIWKPLTKFAKQRKEWAWHTDFALEEGERLILGMGNKTKVLEECPKDKQLKVHLEICVEPFDEHQTLFNKLKDCILWFVNLPKKIIKQE